MNEGDLLNTTEEKLLLISLSLEFLTLGREMMSVIEENKDSIVKSSNKIMISDLFFSLAAATAAKTKNLNFYKVFSDKTVKISKLIEITREINIKNDLLESNFLTSEIMIIIQGTYSELF